MLKMNGKFGRKGGLRAVFHNPLRATVAEIKFCQSLVTVCFSSLPTLAFSAKASFAKFAITGKFVSEGLILIL